MNSNDKIDELYELIEGIEIAMFTTRRADERLISRPMATQVQGTGGERPRQDRSRAWSPAIRPTSARRNTYRVMR
jgi:hypothetical protein